MKKFGGSENIYADYQSAAILLQSIPYDGTSTWGKGADKGFEAFIEASENIEFYDIETDSEVLKKGIHTLPAIHEKRAPEQVYQAVLKKTSELLKTGKFLTFMGGEHSVSIGIIEAFHLHFQDLTVLQLDAHTDLRASYNGSAYNHACALHQASRDTNLIQVGIRSMDSSEKPFFDPGKCFFAESLPEASDWMDRSIDLMTDNVYLTIDLDVFDPSIMPATGTPEPGGLDWLTVVRYMKKVFSKKNVVGFDMVEFAPIPGLHHPEFLVAKLYYRLLSYKFSSI